jgi:hypothetical protein
MLCMAKPSVHATWRANLVERSAYAGRSVESAGSRHADDGVERHRVTAGADETAPADVH